MTNTIIEKFQNECTTYLSTRILSLSSILTDQTTSEYYLNEYKRCIDEQMNFINYLTEQIESLNSLKSCEMAIDTLSEHLKTAHNYEIKQNELLEQILHELTATNPSSKEERRRLLDQIDELMIQKAELTKLTDDNTDKLIEKKD